MKLKHLTLAAVTLLATAGAYAQSAGDTVVNTGWFHISPQDSSQPLSVSGTQIPNTGASVDTADTFGLTVTHFFTDNIAAEAVMGIPPKFHLSGQGILASTAINPLGDARQWSPALLLKYYFGNAHSKLRPYLGLGVSYIWYSDVHLNPAFQQQVSGLISQGATTALPTSAKLSSSWSPVFNAGLTYNFDKHWSAGFSISYLPFSTKATLTTSTPAGPVQSTTKLKLDPFVTFLSIGYRF
ncbi:MAG: outer membrane beta-barrel protein [Burkholderiales bacterium]|nr:outer membrane beta-barrel protein [Burkholderiales bacterium]